MEINKDQSQAGLVLSGPSLLRYSYNQFMVFESQENKPGSHWTSQHWQQGFAHRDSSVSFTTLNQTGKAHISIVQDAEGVVNAARIIRTTLMLPSGKASIEGPDEYPIERFVMLNSGIYAITATQLLNNEDQREVFLSFRRVAKMVPSLVIKSDALLHVPSVLVETCDMA